MEDIRMVITINRCMIKLPGDKQGVRPEDLSGAERMDGSPRFFRKVAHALILSWLEECAVLVVWLIA